jgi:superfamily II DNA/RNA helicase
MFRLSSFVHILLLILLALQAANPLSLAPLKAAPIPAAAAAAAAAPFTKATPPTDTAPTNSFPSTIPAWLSARLKVLNFDTPTEIQALTYAATLPLTGDATDATAKSPPALQPKAFFIHAPTGSGKTLSFLLPLLARLEPLRRTTQALILCPTRDLVLQTAWLCRSLTALTEDYFDLGEAKAQGKTTGKITTMPIASRTASVRSSGWVRAAPPHVVIATPESLADLLKADPSLRKTFGSVSTVVVDEIDAIMDRDDANVRFVLGNCISSTFVDAKERARTRFSLMSDDRGQSNYRRPPKAPSKSEDQAEAPPRLTMFASATIPSRSYFLRSAVKNGWTNNAPIEYIRSTDGVGGEDDGIHELFMPANLAHSYVLSRDEEARVRTLRATIKRDYLELPSFRTGAVIVFAHPTSRNMEEIGRSIAEDFGGLFYEDRKFSRGHDVAWSTANKVVVSVISEDAELTEKQAAVEVWKGEIARIARRMKDVKDARDVDANDLDIESSSGDQKYRDGVLRILVTTTKSFSRGIDCLDCHTVYNLDLPLTGSEYVHRGGRAGRAGRSGRVVSVVGGKKELFVVDKLGREVNADIIPRKQAVRSERVAREGRTDD